MTPLEQWLKLGFLDDYVSSANMGATWQTTRESFSWTHKNHLFNQILDLSYRWSFHIMHLFYHFTIFFSFFLHSMIFDIFSLLKTIYSMFFDINNVPLIYWQYDGIKFKFTTDKAYVFCFSLQYSHYYSIFYFLFSILCSFLLS